MIVIIFSNEFISNMSLVTAPDQRDENSSVEELNFSISFIAKSILSELPI